MPIYYKCNMKPYQHVLAYIVCAIICSVIVYLFYHLVLISVIFGMLLAIYLEKLFADSTITRRQKNLRLQFRDFLGSMTVASRSGKTEVAAIEAALNDLLVSYKPSADIIVEIKYILLQYKNGGIALKHLFGDFADRSGLEDAKSFASIYSVIEGKSDRVSDILVETSEIIGDKIEIEQEIETTITSAKSETYAMLIMPIIMVIAMDAMGGELTEALFNTMLGHAAATVALVLFAVSYVIATKVSNIHV